MPQLLVELWQISRTCSSYASLQVRLVYMSVFCVCAVAHHAPVTGGTLTNISDLQFLCKLTGKTGLCECILCACWSTSCPSYWWNSWQISQTCGSYASLQVRLVFMRVFCVCAAAHHAPVIGGTLKISRTCGSYASLQVRKSVFCVHCAAHYAQVTDGILTNTSDLQAYR